MRSSRWDARPEAGSDVKNREEDKWEVVRDKSGGVPASLEEDLPSGELSDGEWKPRYMSADSQ